MMPYNYSYMLLVGTKCVKVLSTCIFSLRNLVNEQLQLPQALIARKVRRSVHMLKSTFPQHSMRCNFDIYVLESKYEIAEKVKTILEGDDSDSASDKYDNITYETVNIITHRDPKKLSLIIIPKFYLSSNTLSEEKNHDIYRDINANFDDNDNDSGWIYTDSRHANGL